jgi:hypothetical protein
MEMISIAIYSEIVLIIYRYLYELFS